MDDEAKAIHQQMDETRASLTEKLETLEQQIVDTVQGATSAVTETVENVKESIHDTVAEVRETVHDTVDTVKSTFDVQHHVDKHPWVMFAGAVAAGFLAERVVNRLLRTSAPALIPPPAPMPPMFQRHSAPVYGGNGHSLSGKGHTMSENDGSAMPSAPEKKTESGGLTAMFGDEIDHLKKMAIGTTMGFVRDLVIESAPHPVRADLGQILDSVTTKLGGEAVRS